jgi:hypothetical protein
VYASDFGNRIQKYAHDGRLLAVWDSFGTPGTLWRPGGMDVSSSGIIAVADAGSCNLLIRERRAKLVTTTQDILIDELMRQSAMASPAVSSTLMMLELKGSIRQVGAMQFVLAHWRPPCSDRSLVENVFRFSSR